MKNKKPKVLNQVSEGLKRKLKALEVEVLSLQRGDYKKELALRSIANSPRCRYGYNEDSEYGRGITDGHRFDAEIARRALGIK